MKIKYTFVNETIELEVDDAIGKEVKAMELSEESAARTIRNHEIRLDTQNDYSTWMSSETKSEDEHVSKYGKAFSSLTPKQRELIDMLYGPNKITAKEYAEMEGVSPSAIKDRKMVIRKKLKKLL